MTNSEIVQAGYNVIAAAYTKLRSQDSQDSADVALLDELVSHLPSDAVVLDAGCGAGVPVTKYLSQFARVVGVDFSEAQLALARELVPTAKFLCQDLTALDFADESFDAIVSYYAIIHIPRAHHHALYKTFFRLLKPHGNALLCLGANDLADDFEENYLGARMYWSHYDAETNLNLLRESGFEIVWSRLIEDASSPGAGHLFVLAHKP
jgi:ubiquinone/menaquinone biosynthesis C-methylase UbiE